MLQHAASQIVQGASADTSTRPLFRHLTSPVKLSHVCRQPPEAPSKTGKSNQDKEKQHEDIMNELQGQFGWKV